MKYLILAILISTTAQAKENFNYICSADKDLGAEISLLDKNNPSVDLVYKKSKFATCLFETTPLSHAANSRAQVTDAVWQLKLKSCSYYNEKLKDKIKVDKNVTFKEASGTKVSYLAVIENQQPLRCLPKK